MERRANLDKTAYVLQLRYLPRVCHRQRADPSELRVELRPLRVELLAYRRWETKGGTSRAGQPEHA